MLKIIDIFATVPYNGFTDFVLIHIIRRSNL
nr:MAG TPA: hypothetical protein [Caudoviricetes sp.]